MPGQFNPDQNPFAGIMQQSSPMAGMGGGQQAPQGPQQAVPGSTQQQTAQQAGPKQLMEGQEGTGSKFLLGAIQNLQGYIQMSTDPRKISMLRQLITVFVNLLAQEQQEAQQELQGMPEGQEGEGMGMGGYNG